MPSKLNISKKNLAAAAFLFFLAKGLFWLAAGTTLALAVR